MTPLKQIVYEVGNCLSQVQITDPANDKTGGVSVTSKQKSFLAAIAVNQSTPEIPVTEPLIFRKILEAILTGKLIPATGTIRVSDTPPPGTPPPVFDSSKFVPIEEYERMANEYNRIFEQVSSENVVVMSQEEYESLGISDAQIEQFVEIAQQYDRDGAILIIKQILSDDESEG